MIAGAYFGLALQLLQENSKLNIATIPCKT
jgi:hypothetical protein